MNQENDEMRPEYDIRGGVRGKYFQRYKVEVQDSPWIQKQETESKGKHASESTIRIGAEPIYLTLRLKVGELAR